METLQALLILEVMELLIYLNIFHKLLIFDIYILLPHIAHLANFWRPTVHPGEQLKIQRPEIGEGLMASVLPIWETDGNPTLRRNV